MDEYYYPFPKTHTFKFQAVLLYSRVRPDMPTKIDELLKAKRQEILAIAARHGAHNLRVFGSVARGEAGPESDLDILVEMEPGKELNGSYGPHAGPRRPDTANGGCFRERALHWYIRTGYLPRLHLYKGHK